MSIVGIGFLIFSAGPPAAYQTPSSSFFHKNHDSNSLDTKFTIPLNIAPIKLSKVSSGFPLIIDRLRPSIAPSFPLLAVLAEVLGLELERLLVEGGGLGGGAESFRRRQRRAAVGEERRDAAHGRAEAEL